MAPKTPQIWFNVAIPAKMKTAIEAYMKKHDLKRSQFARLAFARLFGKPALASTVRMGRPRKQS